MEAGNNDEQEDHKTEAAGNKIIIVLLVDCLKVITWWQNQIMILRMIPLRMNSKLSMQKQKYLGRRFTAASLHKPHCMVMYLSTRLGTLIRPCTCKSSLVQYEMVKNEYNTILTCMQLLHARKLQAFGKDFPFFGVCV